MFKNVGGGDRMLYSLAWLFALMVQFLVIMMHIK